MRLLHSILAVCVATAAVASFAAPNPVPKTLTAQDQWPDFRGPAGDGHSHGHGVPLEWSETKNVRWKIPLAGRAWSSAVVWGNQIWLTTAPPDGHEMSALCVELATGKVLMDRVIFRNTELEVQGPGHDSNSYASPSPVIEEGRVYLHYGKYGTACLDTRTFKTLWERRDLLCTHSAGPGSSPVLYRDRLILTYDGIDVQFLAALDTNTGKTIWKTPRTVDWSKLTPPANTDVQQRKAFTTPFLTTWEGKPLLISSGAKATCGYDPDTGRELWKVTYPGFSNAARPVAADGVAYITTGYPRADLWAVRLGGSGDVTGDHVLWRLTKNVPLNPSPLLLDGLLYLINGGGILTCVDAKTGEPVWSERLQGPFSASPVLIEGRIYLFNENGRCTVFQPGRQFKKLAENTLDDGLMGSPAVVGDRLVLRAKNRLYLIQASGP
jgi:outer membrane protein assembly factor BamB